MLARSAFFRIDMCLSKLMIRKRKLNEDQKYYSTQDSCGLKELVELSYFSYMVQAEA